MLTARREAAQAQMEQARAALEQADANLSRTSIAAPVAGRVTRLTAAKGDYAAVGQALMMSCRATFGSRRISRKRSSFPYARAIRSISASTPIRIAHSKAMWTASKPAAAPPSACCRRKRHRQLRRGCVQRVPVKIVFDEPPDVLLGPGMSVVPTVRTK